MVVGADWLGREAPCTVTQEPSGAQVASPYIPAYPLVVRLGGWDQIPAVITPYNRVKQHSGNNGHTCHFIIFICHVFSLPNSDSYTRSRLFLNLKLIVES